MIVNYQAEEEYTVKSNLVSSMPVTWYRYIAP